MNAHNYSQQELGKLFGIAGLIIAVLSAFAWFPFNLGASGLAIVLAIVAILHGERMYAIITPLVVLAILLFLSPVTLGIIWGFAMYGNPALLLLVLAFLAAPFGAIVYDNGRRVGAVGPSDKTPNITISRKLQDAARWLRNVSTKGGPQFLLVPQAPGRPLSVNYQDMLQGRSIMLGRMDESDVVLRDNSVSRQHARIAVVHGLGAAICDLGSVNGTFVDGQRIGGRYVPLAGVRKIRLGDCEIAVGLRDEVR